jgi:hypothetical protein
MSRTCRAEDRPFNELRNVAAGQKVDRPYDPLQGRPEDPDRHGTQRFRQPDRHRNPDIRRSTTGPCFSVLPIFGLSLSGPLSAHAAIVTFRGLAVAAP